MFKASSLVLLLAAVAACTAVPTDQNSTAPARNPVTELDDDSALDSWFGLPLFSSFFSPFFKWLPSFNDVAPTIISDDDKFQVAIPVKNYTKDALKVKVKNCFVTVQGSRETKPGDHNVIASQFLNSYSLPANASSEDVTAKLTSDEWLIVTAPVKPDGSKRRTEGERIVDIEETGQPRPKELAPNPKKDAKVEGSTGSKETRDREEVTERDNTIPHGGEAANL